MGQRARALFEPFPPDLNIDEVVETTSNFEFAMRITCDSIDAEPLEDFEKLVLYYVILLGVPLVIEGFQERLDKQLFSRKWLRQNHNQGELLFLVSIHLIGFSQDPSS